MSTYNYVSTYSFGWTPLASYMEEYQILSSNNVWHSISIICDGTKSSSSGDAFRKPLQVQFWRLPMRWLGRGQSPRLTQHLFEKRWIYFQIFGYHIQAEQVTVNPLTTHGILVCHLMYSACSLQQPYTLLHLTTQPQPQCNLFNFYVNKD